MSQPVCPTLSVLPVREGYRKGKLYDPTIRSKFADGRIGARSRHTAVPDEFVWVYRDATLADVDLIEGFQDDVKVGQTVFKHTDPWGNVRFVQLAEPLDIQCEDDRTDRLKITMHVFTSLGTYT